ncbi:MAG: hypothetical protein ABIP30_02260 [Ferruginibacter sp.]
MIKGKTALELNEKGTYDFIGFQNTTWDNVIGIRKTGFIKGVEFFHIRILLLNKEEFIKHKYFLLRPFYRIISFLSSTPFFISLYFIDGTNEEILQNIEDYYLQIKAGG